MCTVHSQALPALLVYAVILIHTFISWYHHPATAHDGHPVARFLRLAALRAPQRRPSIGPTAPARRRPDVARNVSVTYP